MTRVRPGLSQTLNDTAPAIFRAADADQLWERRLRSAFTGIQAAERIWRYNSGMRLIAILQQSDRAGLLPLGDGASAW